MEIERRDQKPPQDMGRPDLTNFELVEEMLGCLNRKEEPLPNLITEIVTRDIGLMELQNAARDGKSAGQVCEELNLEKDAKE